ncbi:hypothetical protein G9F72_019220 [Clostridium estertheticum]|uniref:hypothetical protein n=1 Tax=Clostridium estertheticum TaxID=238834 RepID=UPI001CD0B79C|nr:hypothetical protein [Clostridium estertheticum]MBZ9688464.1 hypothetical protein [Clostridium estertheticum]
MPKLYIMLLSLDVLNNTLKSAYYNGIIHQKRLVYRMKYLTGIHALSLKCKLNTPGNWKSANLTWKKLDLRESSDSIFESWGVEPETTIPNGETYCKANHLRAILDIFDKAEDYTLRLMRCFAIDFLCSDEYNEVFFEKVSLLVERDNWSLVDSILTDEYFDTWLEWKKGQLLA